MNATDGGVFKVFTKINYPVMEAAACELGVTLTTLDHDMQLAEDLFQAGLKLPSTENGWSPKEQMYLRQILPAVREKNRLPPELHVYLVDRGMIKNAPETVGTLLFRETKKLEAELFENLEKASILLKERR